MDTRRGATNFARLDPGQRLFRLVGIGQHRRQAGEMPDHPGQPGASQPRGAQQVGIGGGVGAELFYFRRQEIERFLMVGEGPGFSCRRSGRRPAYRVRPPVAAPDRRRAAPGRFCAAARRTGAWSAWVDTMPSKASSIMTMAAKKRTMSLGSREPTIRLRAACKWSEKRRLLLDDLHVEGGLVAGVAIEIGDAAQDKRQIRARLRRGSGGGPRGRAGASGPARQGCKARRRSRTGVRSAGEASSRSAGAPRVKTMASMIETLIGIAQRPQASERPAMIPVATITGASSQGVSTQSAVASEAPAAQIQASGRTRDLGPEGHGLVGNADAKRAGGRGHAGAEAQGHANQPAPRRARRQRPRNHSVYGGQTGI